MSANRTLIYPLPCKHIPSSTRNETLIFSAPRLRDNSDYTRSNSFCSSLRSRHLEVVCARKNGRARGGHACLPPVHEQSDPTTVCLWPIWQAARGDLSHDLWEDSLLRGKYKIRSTKGRFCEPARMRNPHKPLFSLKPLDTNPPLGWCYIVTTLLRSRSGWSHAMLSTHTRIGSNSSRSSGITWSLPLLGKPYPTAKSSQYNHSTMTQWNPRRCLHIRLAPYNCLASPIKDEKSEKPAIIVFSRFLFAHKESRHRRGR